MDIKNGILKRTLFCALCFSVFFINSCEWVTIEPIVPDLPPPDEVISFSAEIQPIFTSKCVGCHPPTKGLDLTDGNAYNSINNENYINSTTPSESLIYKKPDPNGTHSAKYSITESALVLRWIEEGSQNN